MIRGQIRLGSFVGAISENYITNAVLSEEKLGSQKMKNILRRTRAPAHRNTVRRTIGLARGRSAPLKSRGYIQRKPRVFMGVYSMNIHRRLKKLQRLIPGGRSMQDVDVLFQETADYIVSLKMQVCLLQALSNLCTNTYNSS